MRKTINKKLLTALAISCLSLSAAAVWGVSAPKKTFADEFAGATVADATEFYVENSASVRVDTSGIRFVTYVDKAYHESLTAQGTVTYYAKAKAVGGEEQTKEIPFTGKVNADGDYALYTYINFNNAETTMAEQINELYAQDFTTSTYAKVVTTEGTIYYQAYGDVSRSMRAVGNEAYLNWTEADGYAQNALTKYFTEGNRSTEVTAYALDTGKVAFQMPEYTCTTESVTAYVGAQKHTASYNAASNSYIIENCTTTEENLSIFTADGTVYSTKIAAGIEINNTTIDTVRTATSGNLVLTEDIDMNGLSWTSGTTFTGTIDGQGHKISNFSSAPWPTTFMGIIQYAGTGATIKNLDVHLKTNGWRGGLIGQVKGATLIENVNIVCDSLNCYYSGTIANVIQGTLTVKDTSIVIKNAKPDNDADKAKYSGIIAGGEACNQNVVVSNVVCYNSSSEYATTLYLPESGNGKVLGTDGNDAVAGEDYVIYTSQEAVLNACIAGKVSDEFAASAGVTLTSITQANVNVLQTATSGYYVLTENVDLSEVTWAPTATFAGTLDGNGYKISNLTGSLFKTIGGAKIKNLILDNVATKNNGIIAIDSINADIELNNVIVNVKDLNGGSRSSLLGYQVGGTATLKNVIVDMPKYLNAIKGLLTTHAARTAVLENAYFMGANGTLHSADTASNNATYVPSYVKADGTTAAVQNTDYYIYADAAAFKAAGDLHTTDATFKSMVSNFYGVSLPEI